MEPVCSGTVLAYGLVDPFQFDGFLLQRTNTSASQLIQLFLGDVLVLILVLILVFWLVSDVFCLAWKDPWSYHGPHLAKGHGQKIDPKVSLRPLQFLPVGSSQICDLADLFLSSPIAFVHVHLQTRIFVAMLHWNHPTIFQKLLSFFISILLLQLFLGDWLFFFGERLVKVQRLDRVQKGFSLGPAQKPPFRHSLLLQCLWPAEAVEAFSQGSFASWGAEFKAFLNWDKPFFCSCRSNSKFALASFFSLQEAIFSCKDMVPASLAWSLPPPWPLAAGFFKLAFVTWVEGFFNAGMRRAAKKWYQRKRAMIWELVLANLVLLCTKSWDCPVGRQAFQ